MDELRGSPLTVGTLEEIIDENHAIVSTAVGPEMYVGVLQLVDRTQLEPGCSVLLHYKTTAVVGILSDEADPMVSVMKVDQAPTESYADVGGLESQIQVRPALAPFARLPGLKPTTSSCAMRVHMSVGTACPKTVRLAIV